jgi:exodeoxyribonuclease-3
MWCSAELAMCAKAHRVIEETREWEQPSDHVPLVTEFAF